MNNELLRQWGANIRSCRRMKDRREGRGEAQGVSEMATHLDVSKATVSRWETGCMSPRDDRKIEIAEYLEVDVRMLFPLTRAAA